MAAFEIPSPLLGVLQCLDGYMNIAMEQTEEHVNGIITNRYGDAFIRGNNGMHLWPFGLFHSFLTTLVTRKFCTFRRQSRFDGTLCFIMIAFQCRQTRLACGSCFYLTRMWTRLALNLMVK